MVNYQKLYLFAFSFLSSPIVSIPVPLDPIPIPNLKQSQIKRSNWDWVSSKTRQSTFWLRLYDSDFNTLIAHWMLTDCSLISECTLWKMTALDKLELNKLKYIRRLAFLSKNTYSKIVLDWFSLLLQAKLASLIWGLVASVRRVIGIVIFFTPALGLLDLLWHWHAERFPFQVTILYTCITKNKVKSWYF